MLKVSSTRKSTLNLSEIWKLMKAWFSFSVSYLDVWFFFWNIYGLGFFTWSHVVKMPHSGNFFFFFGWCLAKWNVSTTINLQLFLGHSDSAVCHCAAYRKQFHGKGLFSLAPLDESSLKMRTHGSFCPTHNDLGHLVLLTWSAWNWPSSRDIFWSCKSSNHRWQWTILKLFFFYTDKKMSLLEKLVQFWRCKMKEMQSYCPVLPETWH